MKAAGDKAVRRPSAAERRARNIYAAHRELWGVKSSLVATAAELDLSVEATAELLGMTGILNALRERGEVAP